LDDKINQDIKVLDDKINQDIKVLDDKINQDIFIEKKKNTIEYEVIYEKNLIIFKYNKDNKYYCLNNNRPLYSDKLSAIDILKSFGISYVIADNIEGEHLAVVICRDLGYYGVFSCDGDVLMCKGNIIRYKQGRYYFYNIQEILYHLNISYEKFVKICMILGGDFAPKTKMIGPKTVLKKVDSITLTEEQKKIYDYVLNFTVDYKIIKTTLNPFKLYEYFKYVDKLCLIC
jgi:hypothetical protein